MSAMHGANAERGVGAVQPQMGGPIAAALVGALIAALATGAPGEQEKNGKHQPHSFMIRLISGSSAIAMIAYPTGVRWSESNETSGDNWPAAFTKDRPIST